MEAETRLQIKLNVVKSDMYCNMSIAKDFGWFGMDNKKQNSPVYGKRWKKTPEQKENCRKASLIAFNKPEYKEKISKIRKGKLPLSKEQKEKRFQLYKQVLSLYRLRPELNMPYDYIAKNGKYFSYENAFAKEYHQKFWLKSVRGLLNIIRDNNLTKRLLK